MLSSLLDGAVNKHSRFTAKEIDEIIDSDNDAIKIFLIKNYRLTNSQIWKMFDTCSDDVTAELNFKYPREARQYMTRKVFQKR
jgi:hypothetical protein